MLKTINQIAIVAAGGAIGASLRFIISQMVVFFRFPAWPATIIVNIMGCFFIGLLAGRGLIFSSNNYLLLFLMTGLAGGFTTYSAFNQQLILLLSTQRWIAACLYLITTLTLCLLAGFAGIYVYKLLLK